MIIHWSSNFKRTLEKIIRQSPQKKAKLYSILSTLQQDPFAHQLHTHKLKGELKNCWSCYVEYDIRIIFTFIHDEKTSLQEIFLLDIGSHDEVY